MKRLAPQEALDLEAHQRATITIDALHSLEAPPNQTATNESPTASSSKRLLMHRRYFDTFGMEC